MMVVLWFRSRAAGGGVAVRLLPLPDARPSLTFLFLLHPCTSTPSLLQQASARWRAVELWCSASRSPPPPALPRGGGWPPAPPLPAVALGVLLKHAAQLRVQDMNCVRSPAAHRRADERRPLGPGGARLVAVRPPCCVRVGAAAPRPVSTDAAAAMRRAPHAVTGPTTTCTSRAGASDGGRRAAVVARACTRRAWSAGRDRTGRRLAVPPRRRLTVSGHGGGAGRPPPVSPTSYETNRALRLSSGGPPAGTSTAATVVHQYSSAARSLDV
ncbi:unnamed protein product [Boreogadus saida]